MVEEPVRGAACRRPPAASSPVSRPLCASAKCAGKRERRRYARCCKFHDRFLRYDKAIVAMSYVRDFRRDESRSRKLCYAGGRVFHRASFVSEVSPEIANARACDLRSLNRTRSGMGKMSHRSRQLNVSSYSPGQTGVKAWKPWAVG